MINKSSLVCWNYFIASFLAFISTVGHSQGSLWEGQFLEKINVDKILNWEQSNDNRNSWFVTVKSNKKIGVYVAETCMPYYVKDLDSMYICNIYQGIDPVYNFIGEFKKVENSQLNSELLPYGEIAICIFKKGKSTSIIWRWHEIDFEYHEPKLFFDEINWLYSQGTQVAVMKNNRWGIYDWYDRSMIVECVFESIDG